MALVKSDIRPPVEQMCSYQTCCLHCASRGEDIIGLYTSMCNFLTFQQVDPALDVISLHFYWVALCHLYTVAASHQQKMTKCVLRLIMGLEIGSKSFFRPKSRPKTPNQLIENLWILTLGPISPTRDMYFLRQVVFLVGILYPPRQAGPHLNPRIQAYFFLPKSRGAFCALRDYSVYNIEHTSDI